MLLNRRKTIPSKRESCSLISSVRVANEVRAVHYDVPNLPLLASVYVLSKVGTVMSIEVFDDFGSSNNRGAVEK